MPCRLRLRARGSTRPARLAAQGRPAGAPAARSSSNTTPPVRTNALHCVIVVRSLFAACGALTMPSLYGVQQDSLATLSTSGRSRIHATTLHGRLARALRQRTALRQKQRALLKAARCRSGAGKGDPRGRGALYQRPPSAAQARRRAACGGGGEPAVGRGARACGGGGGACAGAIRGREGRVHDAGAGGLDVRHAAGLDGPLPVRCAALRCAVLPPCSHAPVTACLTYMARHGPVTTTAQWVMSCMELDRYSDGLRRGAECLQQRCAP